MNMPDCYLAWVDHNKTCRFPISFLQNFHSQFQLHLQFFSISYRYQTDKFGMRLNLEAKINFETHHAVFVLGYSNIHSCINIQRKLMTTTAATSIPTALD